MNKLIYGHDRTLSVVTLALGVLIWGVALYMLIAVGGMQTLFGVIAIAIVAAIFSFLIYLFARSAAMAHLLGNGIQVSATQLPGLHAQLLECCDKLSVVKQPTMFVSNGNGVLNAFATWFLGHKYVVLLSNVVEAMTDNPDGVRFYIGHELGHVLRHDNVLLMVLRAPALIFPLLGAASARARESTCDLHGQACCASQEGAARALLALSAGSAGWRNVSLEAMKQQLASASGFWMSFHELTASYPWNAKRIMRVLQDRPEIPVRNPFAYLLASFVPYAGRMGSGLGLLIYVYVIALLAAVAIPAYHDYTVRAHIVQAIAETRPARERIAEYYATNKQVPESLEVAGVAETAPGGVGLSIDSKSMILSVTTGQDSVEFVPSLDGDQHIVWSCRGGEGTKASRLPLSCR
jgi:Zn-dependent protease with chaperone function/type II secretory pathway pseudopilin PulG